MDADRQPGSLGVSGGLTFAIDVLARALGQPAGGPNGMAIAAAFLATRSPSSATRCASWRARRLRADLDHHHDPAHLAARRGRGGGRGRSRAPGLLAPRRRRSGGPRLRPGGAAVHRPAAGLVAPRGAAAVELGGRGGRRVHRHEVLVAGAARPRAATSRSRWRGCARTCAGTCCGPLGAVRPRRLARAAQRDVAPGRRACALPRARARRALADALRGAPAAPRRGRRARHPDRVHRHAAPPGAPPATARSTCR
jgi:hypothetical protein